jgi:hypothetical protein
MPSIKKLPMPLQLSMLVALGTLVIALIQIVFIVRFLVSVQSMVMVGRDAMPYVALAGRLLFAGLAGLVLLRIRYRTPRAAARQSLVLFAALVVLLGANVAMILIEQSGPNALPQTGLTIVLATRTLWIGGLIWIGFDLRKLAATPVSFPV